ncbi:MAG TPA: LysR substrate-binding domain-containing protein, partial [Beijerinckiaceae bacterium]|nr:LysR substrate-binding domain-containing protein [Beijerinckiaceae bacterium]
NSWLAIRDAAVRGLGIARVAEFAVQDLIAAGQLEKLFAGTVHSDQHVHALFPRTPQVPAKLRLLMDFFAARLASRF